MTYKFKYKHKKSIFWTTKNIIGHGIDFLEDLAIDPKTNNIINKVRKPIDSMIIYFEDGGIEKIPEWSSYQLKLGTDWKLFIKNKMEQESGQQIQLKV